MKYKAAVLTCSDRALEEAGEDRSGQVLRESLRGLGFDVEDPRVLPLDYKSVQEGILEAIARGARVVMTAGDTGLQPRDVVVEATEPLLAYELPGIMDEVRRVGAQKTNLSLLSRGIAGVILPEEGPAAVVVNTAGSRGGARDTIGVVGPMLRHMVGLLDGADHDMSRPDSMD